MTKYELPRLPYSYDTLEPYYDARTLELHHDKHHRAYVGGLNAALEKLEAARAAGDFVAIKHLEREVAFHGGGHILHSIFWANLCSASGHRPDPPLKAAIDRSFGSFTSFDQQMRAAANTVEGSGWGILAAAPSGDLAILQVEKHQNQLLPGWTPILVIDVWEHAYYLKYQNRRGEYVDAVMDHLIHWHDVSDRFEAVAGAKR